jgi:hypothetical protein
MAHNFETWHKQGDYEIDVNDNAYDVSPIATAYAYVFTPRGDDVDTCYQGSADPPDDFLCGPNNYSGVT